MLVVIRVLVGFEFVHAAVTFTTQLACSRHCQPGAGTGGGKGEGREVVNYSRMISEPARRSLFLVGGCRCCPGRRPHLLIAT